MEANKPIIVSKQTNPSIIDWFYKIAPSLSKFFEKWFPCFYKQKTN